MKMEPETTNFYEEYFPKSRLRIFSPWERILNVLLIIGFFVSFALFFFDTHSPIHTRLPFLLGMGLLIFLWIYLFRNPYWIKINSDTISFEEKRSTLRIPKKDIDFSSLSTLVRVPDGYMNNRPWIPHAVFTNGTKQNSLRCDVIPYYISWTTNKGVVLIVKSRSRPIFIPTTRPDELLSALNE